MFTKNKYFKSCLVLLRSLITGVLEEAKFFGISSILEQLEEMVKVLVCNFRTCYCGLFPWQEDELFLKKVCKQRNTLGASFLFDLKLWPFLEIS